MWNKETIKKLNERFQNAKEFNPKYKKVFLQKITSFQDLYKLPISKKSDTGLEQINLNNVSFGVISSSGSTGGVPTYTTQSFSDYQFEAQILAESISKNLPNGNILVNTVQTYGPWRGGYLIFLTECFSVSYTGLSLAGRTIEETAQYLYQFQKSKIKGFKGFIFVGLPYFILELGEYIARQSYKLNIKGIVYVFAGIQKIEFTRMQKLYKGVPIHTYVGSTEANGIAFSETPNNVSILTPLYKSVYFWLAGPDTYKPITDPNKAGIIIATSLYSNGKPFNVEMSDMAMWIDKVGGRYQMKGRKSDYVDLRRLSPINFSAIEFKEHILKLSCAHNCQIIIPDFGELVVIIEKNENTRILTKNELIDCLLKVTPVSKEDIIKDGLILKMKFGKIQKTSVGKMPLVIDRRNYAGA